MANFVETLESIHQNRDPSITSKMIASFFLLRLGKEKSNLSGWFFQPSFLSDPRGILNHLFLKDLSFSSEVPSSPPWFSTFESSTVDLLLLPLLVAPAPMWFDDFMMVNEACMPSRCLRSSSTWVSKSSEIHRERKNQWHIHSLQKMTW